MNIGRASEASGLTAKMIRHYESIGLMPPVRRSGAGYRSYSDNDVRTLTFIRRARELGFSLPRIRSLLDLWQNERRHSAEVKALAQQHIGELDRDIARLKSMREQLEILSRHCHGDDRPSCPIIEELEKFSR